MNTEYLAPTLTPEEVRSIHRSLYEAFDRKADGSAVLQGVRAFRKGRPHVRVVFFPSVKNGGYYIACEGRLEAAMAESLEIDPDVAAYRGQPIELPSPNGRSYVPDFAVRFPDGRFTLVDVKPAGKLIDPKVRDRMRWVRSVLSQADLPHCLITDTELAQEPAAGIRKALRQGMRIRLELFEQRALQDLLRDGPMPVSALRAQAQQFGLDRMAIERLVLLGDVTFPIKQRWSETSLIGAQHERNSEGFAARGTVRAVRIALRGGSSS